MSALRGADIWETDAKDVYTEKTYAKRAEKRES